ncbi:ankyrin repeat domain-containing protein [Streptomyces sp. NPDC101733]|uniref:ankyrin repeat domain-containing protein n=1 Tax=unclassified Streptomyces TaxID=2593676 RepID=UPI00382D4409
MVQGEGRELSDGPTTLLRAVEGGSPAVFEEALDAEPVARLPEPERARLLEAARRWYEAGAEAELRRVTGAREPARTSVVRDGDDGRVEEVSLGGRTVRGGHGAILTRLEWELRILVPVEELVARAVRFEDEDHVDRLAVGWILLLRHGAETWSRVVEFHRHPSAACRAFVAGFLLSVGLMSGVLPHARRYEERRLGLLPGWANVESDGGVLALVLGLLEDAGHPRARAYGLRYAGHPDPRVRSRVPGLFDRPLDPETARVVRDLGRDPAGEVRAMAAETLGREEPGEEDRALLLALLRDEDPQVGARAAFATALGPDRSPEVTGALLELLDADERDTRLSAAFGLARRGHPRTPEAYERVGPLGPELAGDHRADGLWRWRGGNEPGG